MLLSRTEVSFPFISKSVIMKLKVEFAMQLLYGGELTCNAAVGHEDTQAAVEAIGDLVDDNLHLVYLGHVHLICAGWSCYNPVSAWEMDCRVRQKLTFDFIFFYHFLGSFNRYFVAVVRRISYGNVLIAFSISDSRHEQLLL